MRFGFPLHYFATPEFQSLFWWSNSVEKPSASLSAMGWMQFQSLFWWNDLMSVVVKDLDLTIGCFNPCSIGMSLWVE